jgi:hypothetical protein
LIVVEARQPGSRVCVSSSSSPLRHPQDSICHSVCISHHLVAASKICRVFLAVYHLILLECPLLPLCLPIWRADLVASPRPALPLPSRRPFGVWLLCQPCAHVATDRGSWSPTRYIIRLRFTAYFSQAQRLFRASLVRFPKYESGRKRRIK